MSRSKSAQIVKVKRRKGRKLVSFFLHQVATSYGVASAPARFGKLGFPLRRQTLFPTELRARRISPSILTTYGRLGSFFLYFRDTVVETSTMESANQASQTQPTPEQIRQRAYDIYVSRKGALGDEVEDWLQAERELRAGQS